MSSTITTVVRLKLLTVCNWLSIILPVTSNCCNSEIFPAGGNGVMSGDNHYGLEVGSKVEVPMADGVPRYGVIRWMGNMPQVKEKVVAGLELVSEIYQSQSE